MEHILSTKQVEKANKDMIEEVFCNEERVKNACEDILIQSVCNSCSETLVKDFFSEVFTREDMLNTIGETMEQSAE